MSEAEHRKQLARGFARFVIRQGRGECCPVPYPGGKPKTWLARGREIYGLELFNQVMHEEIATREEWIHAEERLSPVRSDQGIDAAEGGTVGRSEDPGREDLEQSRLSRAELTSDTPTP